MKQLSLVTIFLAVVVGFLMVTGFQCGSAEVTSAKLYHGRKDWPAAINALEKELEKNPINAEAWYLLGNSRLNLALEKLEKKEYDSSGFLFQGMVRAYDSSLAVNKEFEPKINYDETVAWQNIVNGGVKLYNRSMDLSKNSPASDSTKMYRQFAEQLFDAAIAARPDSVYPYQLMSMTLQADGQADKAFEFLNRARKIKESPEILIPIINYHLSKGTDALSKGDSSSAKLSFDMAIIDLQKARALDPSNAELNGVMIDAYLKAGRSQEAMPILEEAIKQDPNNKVLHFNLGVLLLNSGELEEATNHFDAVINIDPSYDVALQNAAVAQMRLGDKKKKAAEAAAEGKKNAKVDKSYQEHFKAAVGYFEKLVSLKPNDADVVEYLASAYANAGDYKKAEEMMKKADALRHK